MKSASFNAHHWYRLALLLFIGVFSISSLSIIQQSNFNAQLSIDSSDGCYSSDDCLENEVCTVELGECNRPPGCGPNDICPTVCTGSCIEKTDTTAPEPELTLTPSVVVTDGYASQQECSVELPCPPLLWLELAQSDGITPLTITDNPALTLEFWQEESNNYGPKLSPTIIPDPSGNIKAVSFPLATTTKTAPYHNLHTLTISIGNEVIAWSVLATYVSSGQLPTITVSNPNQPLSPASLPPLPQVTTVTSQFPDISAGSLLEGSANALVLRGVIRGYDDGTFKPKRLVNRAEAAKMLLLARYGSSLQISSNASNFPDVEVGSWYEPYVVAASALGIINGYPNGLFLPNNTINTAEFLKMLARTFDLPESLSHSFIDIDNDDWFARFAGTVPAYNLLPLRPGYVLWPSMNMTREEVVIAIVQALAVQN